MQTLPSSSSVLEPVEPFELYAPASGCDAVAKPGVEAFKDFILGTVGVGSNGGIVRDCSVGKPSLHHLGRAWDWMVSAFNPVESAAAEAVLAWLLSPDDQGNEAAWYRRVGLQGVIWNGQSWGSSYKTWRPYTGENPHTNHVHFSFGVPGSLGETSFYRFIKNPWTGPDVTPASPEPLGTGHSNLLAAAMGAALGFGLGYIASGKIAHSIKTTGVGIWPRTRRV